MPARRPPGLLLQPLLIAALLALGSSGAWAQAATAASAAASAPAGPVLRPEVAKPLGAAQDALRAGQYADALARVTEAEAVPDPSAFERYTMRRLRAPALFGAGQPGPALEAFDALVDDPQLPAADRRVMVETTIKIAIQQKDYARAIKRLKPYADEPTANPELVRLLPQLQSATGDHAGAAAGFKAQVAAEEAAGRPVTESMLRMLASSQGQAGDEVGYLASLEKLAASTGKPDYWNELIARTARRDGFAGERLRLDIYRLRQAVGIQQSAGEVGDMAHRANQAGLPAEAQKLLDDGFTRGLLGQDGNAAADRQLRAAATKAAAQDRAAAADAESALRNAKDGNAAVGLGMALSGAGLHDKAIALMTQGQAKGGLRRPDDAMLHLGVAQWRAGRIDDALKSFGAVGGSDGAADLARLWSVWLRSPAARK